MTSKRGRIDSLGSRSSRNAKAAAMTRSGSCPPPNFSAKAVLRFALAPIFVGLLLLSAGDAPWIVHGYIAMAGATTGLYYGSANAV